MSSNNDQSMECEKDDTKLGSARRDEENDVGGPDICSLFLPHSPYPNGDDRKQAAVAAAANARHSQNDEKAAYREQLDIATHIVEQHAGIPTGGNALAAGSGAAVLSDIGACRNASDTQREREQKGRGSITETAMPINGSSAASRTPGIEYIPRVAPGFNPSLMPVRQVEPLTAVTVAPVEAQLTNPEEAHLNENRSPKNSKMFFYRAAVCVAVLLVGVAVVVGVILGTNSKDHQVAPKDGPSAATNSNLSTSFSPITTDCNEIRGQLQPHVYSQCNCTGNVSIVAADIAARYQNLTATFIHSVFTDFNESMSSCSPKNQALLWLASGAGATSNTELTRMRQRYTFALLFNLWNGPNWLRNLKWLSSQDECKWQGLECNGMGDVTNISLLANNVVVDLPPISPLLTNLESLSVRSSSLMGNTLPTEVGSLSHLKRLELKMMGINGTLPTNFFNILKTLQYFDASENQISGTLSPTQFGNLNLSQLKYLDLSLNQLTGTLPTELGRCTNLVAFEFQENHLNGTLPSEIGMMSALEQFDLGENDFTGTIPTELGRCKKLLGFGVTDNHFHGNIPVELASLNLSYGLNIRTNQLHVPEAVCQQFVTHPQDCNGCDC